MLEIGLLKMGHLLCLVYWLGADLAVFYSSYFVQNEKLSAETRVSMAKLLFALDQGPRICMPLILAFGVHLAWRLAQLNVPASVVAATWLICLGWLAMVLALHLRGTAAKELTAVDYWFRIAVVTGLGGYAIYSLFGDRIADWLALKFLVYAALVGCGLMVRRKLRPFAPAFKALVEDRVSDADNAAIRRSLSTTRPFVIAIWAGLLVNTALGLHLF